MIERLRIYWYSQQIQTIPVSYHQYLSKYNDYYNKLNPELQEAFRKRVVICLKFLTFNPVHFNVVTEEMKIVIASALIQITFGLDKYILRRFKTILVVPNTYSFREFSALLGHVDHTENLIAMSWPSVKEGFIIPDDANNVALHELAHALQAENYERLFFSDFFDAIEVNNWEKEGITELWKIRKHKHTYLRDYAGQNMLELFAVSMECFFEQPEAFQNHVPGLYLIMTKLLKQDPNTIGNPLFTTTN